MSSLTNDLTLALEVDSGDGWKPLYPGQTLGFAWQEIPVRVVVRLREEQGIATCFHLPGSSCSQTMASRDLGQFGEQVQALADQEEQSISKHAKLLALRKGRLEAKRDSREFRVFVGTSFVSALIFWIPSYLLVFHLLDDQFTWWNSDYQLWKLWLACFCLASSIVMGVVQLVSLYGLGESDVWRALMCCETTRLDKIWPRRSRLQLVCAAALAAVTCLSLLAAYVHIAQPDDFYCPCGEGCVILFVCSFQNYVVLFAFLPAEVAILIVFTVWAGLLLRRQQLQRALEKTISFHGRVLQQSGQPCICSWPGKYATEWDRLVESSQSGEISAAVVFLPEGTRQFGIHDTIPASQGLKGECWCIQLYGEKKKWGCRWWSKWMENVEKAQQSGQELHVYFFAGMCGRGKVESFSTAGEEHQRRDELFETKMSEFEKSSEYQNAETAGLGNLSRKKREDGTSQYSREKERLWLAWLPDGDRQFLERSVGLGNSQKAEVAWLEKKGYLYKEMDISRWLQDEAKEPAPEELGASRLQL